MSVVFVDPVMTLRDDDVVVSASLTLPRLQQEQSLLRGFTDTDTDTGLVAGASAAASAMRRSITTGINEHRMILAVPGTHRCR